MENFDGDDMEEYMEGMVLKKLRDGNRVGVGRAFRECGTLLHIAPTPTTQLISLLLSGMK